MIKAKDFPRFMVCAPSSGSGKTLITCALLRILEKHGYKCASYKCGPDYIDPMFHSKVLNIPSRNLDLFLMGHNGIKKAIVKGSIDKDIGVMEGVMGFYDGMKADSVKGSSYDICAITGSPAILVVNCKGMSKSVIALIKGFADYDKKGLIKGVILNNISSMVADSLKKDIEDELNIPVIGMLPKLAESFLESRHLGLVMPSEIEDILAKIDRVSGILEQSLDMDKLINIARSTGDILRPGDVDEETSYSIKAAGLSHATEPVRVGVAMDEAFCFYYEDNLDLLKEMGASITFFSPIHDPKLPEVSRIILGGGYPELHAGELSQNASMKEDILRAANNGMPILAECGGFMYLQERLSSPDKETYEMVGVLKGSGSMRDRLGHFGYVTVRSTSDNPYLKVAEEIRAHEFHYYDTSDNGDTCLITKPSGKSWTGIQVYKNVFAGFAHLYYPSRPEMIARFLAL